MASLQEIMQVCRLCLVSDQVNVPIFDGTSDIRETFAKISSCLPVKVSKDDNLPKKICEGCSYKLDLLYDFRNTSVSSEKQLLQWLQQIGVSSGIPTTAVSSGPNATTQTNSDILVKQESFEHNEGAAAATAGGMSAEAQSYIMQQQKLPYRQEFPGFGESSTSTSEPPPKRARRAAAMKAPIAPETDSDEDDLDNDMTITKAESDDDSDEPDQPSYVDATSTSVDDQPGPSGVGKPSVEARFGNDFDLERMLKCKLPEVDVIPVTDDAQTKFRLKSLHEIVNSMTPGLMWSKYKNPFVYDLPKKGTRKLKKKAPNENKTIKWSCMICSEVQQDKQSLIDHYEFHKNETENLGLGDHTSGDYFLCSVCLTDFTSLKSYEKHVEEQHGEKQFSCDECQKFFKNCYQLCIHNYNVHSEDKIYKCVLCPFTTKHLNSLRPHLKQQHEDDAKYRCEICHRGFTSATWYDEHKNFHTGAMPFKCNLCFKSFPYSRYLVAHKRLTHPDAEDSSLSPHECEICRKRFAHKKSLVLHVRGHFGENQVLCEMCGKSLSSAEHLKQHIRIHTGYKPHTCSVCGKSFAKKCNLTLHERVHSGEKPYICPTCHKCFSQRSTLVIHMRYHSGERPYACHLCLKGFVAKGLLGVHLKTCTGVMIA